MSSGPSYGGARLLQSVEERTWPKIFSVCCLVNDWEGYAVHRQALRAQGFDDQFCEFLVCDNAGSNKFSAFQAVRRFLQEATGKYVIIAHADTAPLEPITKLISALENLTTIHPNWGVVGNAGVGGSVFDPVAGKNKFAHAFSVKMPDIGPLIGHAIVKVECVDENVMIVRNGSGLTVSNDLKGFHFYALDLCLIAQRLGYEIFVVDYLWRHDSHGTIDSVFFNARDVVQKKLKDHYSRLHSPTCCSTLYWGRSRFAEICSNLQAIRNLDADPIRRSESRDIFFKRLSEQYKCFPVFYWSIRATDRVCYKANSLWYSIKALPTRGIRWARSLRDFVYWRFIWRIKITARLIRRDLMWWRLNWRTRLLGERKVR